MIRALMLKYETGTEEQNPMKGKDPLEIIINAAETYSPDILLAPEFFLYNGGKPCSRKEKGEIEREIAGRAGKEGRLIIPGTIIWGLRCFYNTAPIISGRNISEYHKSTDGGVYSVAERHRIDARLGKEDGRIIGWKNFNLGLEICLEHDYGKLKKRGTSADIHIIIGCGARISNNSIIARNRGYALLCDGSCHVGIDTTSNKAMINDNGIFKRIEPGFKTETEELYELEI